MKNKTVAKTVVWIMSVCIAVLIYSTAKASNYGDTFGFSPKGMSLGNAMTARVSDWSSVYYNIAGLGKSKGSKKKNQLFLGYMGNAPVFDIDIDRQDDDGEPLATRGDEDLETGTLVFGGVLDANLIASMPSFISTARAGVAVAMNDDQSVVKINDLDPRTHNFMRYGRECQKMTVMGGMGFGFMNDLFGFGLGVNSSFSGDGTVLLEHVELDTDPQSPPGQAKMDMNMDHTLLAGIYFSPVKSLDIGISYRAETKLDIYPFNTAAATDLGGIPLNLVLALDDYYHPEVFSLGIAYSFGKCTISADIEYEMWSGFEASVPMQDNFAGESTKFDDIITPEIGFQFDFNNSVDLLFGYYYEQSFIPDEAVSDRLNFLDNDKHVLSCGLVYTLPQSFFLKGRTELSAGYQLQYLVDRDVTKDAASTTPQNPGYSYSGTCHSVMIGLTMNL